DLAATPAEAARILRLSGAPRGIALRLPAQDVLHTTISLPLAAERNLAQVVDFEFERRTPFKRAEACYAFRPLRRDAAGQRLLAALTVAPRRAVDQALATARRLGIEVTSIDAAPGPGEPASPNLLGPNILGTTARRGRATSSGAVAGLALLALF